MPTVLLGCQQASGPESSRISRLAGAWPATCARACCPRLGIQPESGSRALFWIPSRKFHFLISVLLHGRLRGAFGPAIHETLPNSSFFAFWPQHTNGRWFRCSVRRFGGNFCAGCGVTCASPLCGCRGRAGSALCTAVVPGGLVELLLRWLYGARGCTSSYRVFGTAPAALISY